MHTVYFAIGILTGGVIQKYAITDMTTAWVVGITSALLVAVLRVVEDKST